MTDALTIETMTVTDPVCRREISFADVMAQEDYRQWAYFFCSMDCRDEFRRQPARYASAPHIRKAEPRV